MSKVASFKPFYNGHNHFVVLERIKHFASHSSNGFYGTKIHFYDGTDLLVGEYPETVREAIEQAGEV
ncbi:hypothetical protein [Shewanella baltica]|uniref:hypothetical protein n=1 Tax=Shewanella baltica TaxID=62322 RepID=UPI003D79E2EA